MRPAKAGRIPYLVKYLLGGLYIVLVLLDHLLDHLTADGTRLTRREIAVVTFLEVYANFVGCFHFELIESVLRLGDEFSVVARCHFRFSCSGIADRDAKRIMMCFTRLIYIELSPRFASSVIIVRRFDPYMNGNFLLK